MSVRVLEGDARAVLATLPDASVQCCVTSPPYFGLRDYGTAKWEGGREDCEHKVTSGGPSMLEGASQRGRSDVAKGNCPHCGARRLDSQLGLERTPDAFVASLVSVFRDVRRVLRDDGTLWLNLGDSYANTKVGSTNGTSASTLADSCNSPRAAREGYAERAAANANVQKQLPPGLKSKDLVGIPWRVAFALQADGWYLRSDIIWHKPNPMPESVTDRPTKAHEYVFLLAKSDRYFYDAEAIAEEASYGSHGGSEANPGEKAIATGNHSGSLGLTPRQRESKKRGEFNGKTNALPGREAFRAITETRNRRSVWTVATSPYSGAHFATFPPKLIEPCVLAGSRKGDTILDPFGGAGTTGLVADRLGRNAILIELNPEYAAMARTRIQNDNPLFTDVA